MEAMSSGLASLYKILKDETRMKTILLLSEKEAMSYTELMDELGIVSTGMLNYHLKILGELLTKTEDGKYTLTEKIMVAARLLREFPEKSKSQIEAELPRALYVGASISSAAYITIVLALYSLTYMDFAAMITNIFAAVSAVILLFIFGRARKKRAEWSPRKQRLGAQLSIMFAGAWAGAVVGFFGGGLMLIGIISLLRSTGLMTHFTPSQREFNDLAFWVLTPILGAILGGFVGYLIFKRSRFFKAGYYDNHV